MILQSNHIQFRNVPLFQQKKHSKSKLVFFCHVFNEHLSITVNAKNRIDVRLTKIDRKKRTRTKKNDIIFQTNTCNHCVIVVIFRMNIRTICVRETFSLRFDKISILPRWCIKNIAKSINGIKKQPHLCVTEKKSSGEENFIAWIERKE